MKFRYRISIYLFIFSLLVLFSLGYYLFCTSSGGRFIVTRLLGRYPLSFDADMARVDGSLTQQLTLRDIELKNIEGWPFEAVVRIQKADVYFASLDPNSLNIEVHNARLLFPSLGTIVVNAIYQDSRLDADIFSASIETGQMSELFSEAFLLKNSSGVIRDLNVSIKGPLDSLELSGSFFINTFLKDALSFKDIPVVFNLLLQDAASVPKLSGELAIEKGFIMLPLAAFELAPGKIQFKGDLANPLLDLRGSSRIEGADVKALLRGELLKPELKLTSEPPMPQDKLIVMVLTGLGDVSFQYDEEAKVFSLKKELAGKVGVSYGSAQSGSNAANAHTVQKVGMSYKVTDSISIVGEKELQPKNVPGNQTGVKPADDALFLKYKKKF